MKYIELDKLREMAEGVCVRLDELAELRAVSELIAHDAEDFEDLLKEAEAGFYAKSQARKRRLERLASTISVEPKAQLERLKKDRYAFLQEEKIKDLEREVEAEPETSAEKEYRRLTREPVTLDSKIAEELEGKLRPLLERWEALRRNQAEICNDLAARFSEFASDVEEAMKSPHRYLAPNRLDEDMAQLNKMRKGV